MLKLVRYLKDFKWVVLLIVALLAVQAVCELSLPAYTADIVDIGITRGGIVDITPTRMRTDTLDALALFVTDEQEATLRGSYELDADGSYTLLSGADRAALDEMLTLPLAGLVFSSASQGAALADIPAGMAAMVKMGVLNKSVLQERMASGMASQGASLDQKTIGAAASKFTAAEYEALGMDMEAIQTRYMLITGGKMLGLTLLSALVAVIAGFFASRTSGKLGMDLRGKVYKRVMAFSNGDIEKFSTASLITRSTTDIQRVQMGVVMMLRIVAYAPILGIGGLLKVIATKTNMGWIIAVAVGLLLLIVAFLLLVAMPRFRKMPTLIDHVNLIAREILTGIMPIRAFSREEHENQRFEVANANLMKNQLFVNRTMSLMMPLMMLIMNGITLAIVWFGGKGIDAGGMMVGDMMAFITYSMQIVMAFLMLTMVSVMLPNAMVSAGRIDEVLNTPASISDKPETKDSLMKDPKGQVTFENVSFRYPDAAGNVLENISFTAKPGETTAILGGTGSGKSTLLNLIPRFYDVTQGRVTVDGIDIRDLSQKKLHSLMGYVPQKGKLFTGTIESNIKYGGEQITDEAMMEAADIAQAKDFIVQREDGYRDAIAQDGKNVSGGQRQRLSIARALAVKPKVLLFDDSFSALDYKTDAALRRALAERAGEATIVVVAQRISTVLHANQIIVLEEGKMVGLGTHGELMETCREYQEIARSQLSEAELKGGATA